MKLELKHLSPYLPYGLECITYFDGAGLIRGMDANLMLNIIDRSTSYMPIMRPLSDLTNEIKINGEWVIPIDLLGEDVNQFCDVDFVSDWSQRGGNFNDYVNEFINKKFGNHHLSFLPYGFIQKLLEWHFDVFGLIDEKLAIYINTFKK